MTALPTPATPEAIAALHRLTRKHGPLYCPPAALLLPHGKLRSEHARQAAAQWLAEQSDPEAALVLQWLHRQPVTPWPRRTKGPTP